MNPTSSPQSSVETQQAPYPWGTLAASLLGIGAAHALGYATAGVVADALLQGPVLGRYLRDMDPASRKLLAGALVSGAGSAAALSAGMASAGRREIIDQVRAEETRKRQHAASLSSQLGKE